MTQFPDVSSKYGAPMGRRSFEPQTGEVCRLFRVRINSGGYDDGGAYWGIGQPLYCLLSEEGQQFYRAYSREEAKEYFASKFPGIRFYR